jgi:hypothetical protein
VSRATIEESSERAEVELMLFQALFSGGLSTGTQMGSRAGLQGRGPVNGVQQGDCTKEAGILFCKAFGCSLVGQSVAIVGLISLFS